MSNNYLEEFPTENKVPCPFDLKFWRVTMGEADRRNEAFYVSHNVLWWMPHFSFSASVRYSGVMLCIFFPLYILIMRTAFPFSPVKEDVYGS